MNEFIALLIAAALSPLRVAIAAIVARFSALWATTTGFWTRTRDEFARWIGLAHSWATAGGRFVRTTFVVAAYTIRWFVPNLVAQAATDVYDWATGFVSGLISDVLGKLAQVRDWIIARVNDVINALVTFRTWAFGQLGELKESVTALLRHVFGPLSTPDKLAAWIVGAMFAALVHYLIDNAVPIGRAIWAQRVKVTAENLDRVEDIFTRII